MQRICACDQIHSAKRWAFVFGLHTSFLTVPGGTLLLIHFGWTRYEKHKKLTVAGMFLFRSFNAMDMNEDWKIVDMGVIFFMKRFVLSWSLNFFPIVFYKKIMPT